MNEAEWLACGDPSPILQNIRGKASDRKLRLFAAVCCRKVWHLLPDQRCWRAVETAEQSAEGRASNQDLIDAGDAAAEADLAAESDALKEAAAAVRACVGALYHCTGEPTLADVAISTLTHAAYAVALDLGECITLKNPYLAGRSVTPAEATELAEQANLLRDVFANPFRPITLDRAHRTPTVVSLARAAYDERHLPSGELDPHRLAVLADALEEVGAAGELVAHLRGPGPHVRGCWAIDAILGLD
jgi:hypothetical protein